MEATREDLVSGEDEGRGVKVNRDCFLGVELRVWGIFAGVAQPRKRDSRAD